MRKSLSKIISGDDKKSYLGHPEEVYTSGVQQKEVDLQGTPQESTNQKMDGVIRSNKYIYNINFDDELFSQDQVC